MFGQGADNAVQKISEPEAMPKVPPPPFRLIADCVDRIARQREVITTR
jgi:hypothetical protein